MEVIHLPYADEAREAVAESIVKRWLITELARFTGMSWDDVANIAYMRHYEPIIYFNRTPALINQVARILIGPDANDFGVTIH